MRFRWTVIVRRFDGSTDFDKTWAEYERGFGDAAGEYWLGNEYLFYLSISRSYKLRVDMEDWNGTSAYAEYSSFRVTSKNDKYRLLLGDYSGNASADATDDFLSGFLHHNNSRFSAHDEDNDNMNGSCMSIFELNGFWYNDCVRVTPTGSYCRTSSCSNQQYSDGLMWGSWRGEYYSLKTMTMMIRPVDY